MTTEPTITLPLAVVMAVQAYLDPIGSTAQALTDAIDAALWEPPAPAVITRVACTDHPHPTDGTWFLAWTSDEWWGLARRSDSTESFTHWTPMPTWVDQ